jgi:hypothetical protein
MNIDFDLSGFEEALEAAIDEGVQGVMAEMEATARQVSCPEHGKASSIYFDRLEPRPEQFFVRPCCDKGKDLVYKVLGITETHILENKNEEENMKQSEKLDIILRGLYERRDGRQWDDAQEILKEKGIEVSDMELDRLKERLTSDRLVEDLGAVGHALLKITSRGVEYCEEDSYSYRGRSLLSIDQSVNISGSEHINVIANSTNSSIQTGDTEALSKALASLQTEIEGNQELSSQQREDMMESLVEAKDHYSKGMKPKGAIKHILEVGKSIAAIASLATTILGLLN